MIEAVDAFIKNDECDVIPIFHYFFQVFVYSVLFVHFVTKIGHCIFQNKSSQYTPYITLKSPTDTMLKQMESIAVPERSEEETQELQRDEVRGSKLSIRNSASLKGRIFLTICQFSDNSLNSIFAKSKVLSFR